MKTFHNIVSFIHFKVSIGHIDQYDIETKQKQVAQHLHIYFEVFKPHIR